MTRAGYEIMHSVDGSSAIHRQTGHTYKIYERGGVYAMLAWIDKLLPWASC